MFDTLPLLVFTAALLLAALWDVSTLTIPNLLTAGLTIAFFGAAPLSGMPLGIMGGHVLLGLIGLVVGMLLFAGGFVGGWLDNAFGSKRAIQISILGTSLGTILAVSMTPHSILFMDYSASEPFWDGLMFQTLPEICYVGVVILIAIFITSAYANSRTMLARLAPEERMSQFFGLYALSGTATAFVGHGLVAFLTSYYDSQRIGFAGVLVLLIAGFILMSWVKEERSVVAD